MADKKRNPEKLEGLRKVVEGCSTFGLLLVAAGLVAPFANIESAALATAVKWIYAAGALIFTIARMVNVNDPEDSARLRRLRRMEMWAGFCFCIGAAFWIYNATRWPGTGFTLPMLRDTIGFTLAGAAIQVIASWMISSLAAKEARQRREIKRENDRK